MGQYHTIYNRTKKEYFSIGGAKLCEKGGDALFCTALLVLLSNSNGRGGGDIIVQREYTKDFKPKKLTGKKRLLQEALDEISGRWAGDSIVLQGDYAEKADPAFISEEEEKEYTSITNLVLEGMEAAEYFHEEIKNELKRFGR